MTKPKHLKDRRPDGRFGKTNYVGPKPSENFDWDAAIKRRFYGPTLIELYIKETRDLIDVLQERLKYWQIMETLLNENINQ